MCQNVPKCANILQKIPESNSHKSIPDESISKSQRKRRKMEEREKWRDVGIKSANQMDETPLLWIEMRWMAMESSSDPLHQFLISANVDVAVVAVVAVVVVVVVDDVGVVLENFSSLRTEWMDAVFGKWLPPLTMARILPSNGRVVTALTHQLRRKHKVRKDEQEQEENQAEPKKHAARSASPAIFFPFFIRLIDWFYFFNFQRGNGALSAVPVSQNK